jgi:hypothetical protein
MHDFFRLCGAQMNAVTYERVGVMIQDLSQLLSTGVRYLISRPRTSRNTRETLRSIDNNTQFRVSNAQAAAEAQLALSKGDKNL